MTGRHFDKSLGCLVSPALDELATQLFFAGGLSARERDLITDATRESLHTVLHSKVSRLLVLELNAARVTRRLGGVNSEQRWQQFLELSDLMQRGNRFTQFCTAKSAGCWFSSSTPRG